MKIVRIELGERRFERFLETRTLRLDVDPKLGEHLPNLPVVLSNALGPDGFCLRAEDGTMRGLGDLAS